MSDTAQPATPGLRRRADKLRFVALANVLGCVVAGLCLDFGETAARWIAVVLWAVLFLIVCYGRAAQMDQDGPKPRR